MKILITGAAGFIGMHLSIRLIKLGHSVLGLDNLNSYYDVSLKKDRLDEINKLNLKFTFIKLDLKNALEIDNLFKSSQFDIVINLAAQAGVRYSIENPQEYLESNINGFFNILESCKKYPVKHLIFSSSSSVYGLNEIMPFIENHDTSHPISFYGATKKCNEIMAHSYAYLYKIPITGLRFFTVYGPWGRPDMAPFIFTKAIKEGKKIKIFNNGNMKRDFTYIDDIINGVEKIILKPIDLNKVNFNEGFFNIFNIGNSKPINLLEFIDKLEKNLEKKSIKEFLPMQSGDVFSTFSNIDKIKKFVGFSPNTTIDEGIKKFILWYNHYYN